ncbi:hypothetical protein KKG31_05140 [Patescibacteria group bacterium]|nr:hypothetical protein [Patescibacteria group bacterium]MBU1758508.1 hypothetical protein [Patescibacteria group bacterium]
MSARNADYIKNINTQFKTKTIITISHLDSIVLMQKAFHDFDYIKEKDKYRPNNGNLIIHYRDNDRNTEVDLHKPYIDNYWFSKK